MRTPERRVPRFMIPIVRVIKKVSENKKNVDNHI